MKKVFLGSLYWLVQLTWGALLTIPGLLVSLFCIIFLHGKAYKNGFSYIVEVGGDWGGINLGAVSLCGGYASKDSKYYNFKWFEHTRRHEFGHSIQTLIFGPFQLFVVSIPSAIRYWYDVLDTKHIDERTSPLWYDSIWFEGTATRWGTKAIECINTL